MNKKVSKHKKHIIYISIILLLSCTFLYKYFDPYTFPMRGGPDIEGVKANDYQLNIAFNSIVRESLRKGHIPFWSPYTLSGTPHYSKPQVPVFYISTIFMLTAPTAWAGLKWSVLFHFFLAGLNMYLLMVFGLRKTAKIGFISAIAYMFSNYLINDIIYGHPNIIYPYAWFPLIFLFAIKAFETRKWIEYSIAAGIVFSLELLSGGVQLFFGNVVLFGCFLLFMIIGKNFNKRVIKALLIGAIVTIVFFGLTAVKVLPTKELMKIGVRSQAFSFDRTFGHKSINTIFKMLIYPGIEGISIVSFILVLMGLAQYKKKKVLIFWGLLIFSLLLLSGSFVAYAVWKFVPFINKLRGLGGEKWLILFIFPASVLAGCGAESIINYIKKKLAFPKLQTIVPLVIVILLLTEIVGFGQKIDPMSNIEEELEKNKILQYISKDDGIFRIHMYETRGIDWGTEQYTIPLGLQDVYGTDNIWLIDYLPIYLSVANTKRAKLFGVLNMKYLTSMNPLNIPGFEFVGKFEECGTYPNGIDICQPKKSDGPYLYKNKLFLPRAYIVSNSILIVGEDAPVKQIMHGLMADDSYNPSTTVIIKGKGMVQDYDLDFLEKFDAIILATGSVNQDSVYLLDAYTKKGGKLIPDITKGETSMNKEEIDKIFKKGDSFIPKDKELSYPTNNKAIINLKEGYNGFLVMSEKYSMFPGWTAKLNGKEKEILRANGVISAVYLEEEKGDIVFEYKPKSFVMGAWISSITLLLIISYFTWFYIKRKKKKI